MGSLGSIDCGFDDKVTVMRNRLQELPMKTAEPQWAELPASALKLLLLFFPSLSVP